MKKYEKVGLTTIEYDEKTTEVAKELIKKLKSNYYAIMKFIEKDRLISFIDAAKPSYFITDIEDFKKILGNNNQLTEKEFEPLTIPQEISFLKILILEKLECLEEINHSVALRTDCEQYINNIYSLLANKYYKENDNKDEYINFLIDLPEEEKEKIFNWLNERRRVDLYNDLLEEEYNIITRTDEYGNMYDPFIKNNLEKLIDYIQQDTSANKIIKEENIDTKTLTKLSTKELESLMEEYLIRIDPSLKWLEIYKQAMAKGDIVYTVAELEWFCISENNEMTISAPLSNTLIDFPNLVHEFMHYISNKNIGNYDYIYNSIREYPSLFFEMDAINFLLEKGYDQPIINTLLNERKKYTQNNKLTATSILLGILQKQKSGVVTKETIISNLKNVSEIKGDLPSGIKRYIYGIVPIADQSINDFIDEENEFMLYDKKHLIDAYPYITSSYLTKKTEEKLQEDPSKISTVIEITENLVNETFTSIIEKLGIKTEFNLDKTKKQYTKKNKTS